jgi:serine phosphatase RsbU (regulator of sigma subunit)
VTGHLDHAAVLRAGQGAHPGSVVELVATSLREIGASDVVAYLVDFEQEVLEPLPDRAAHLEIAHAEPVATSMAGRAFLTCAPVTAERPNGVRVWVPIVEASNRTGVLAVTLQHPDDAMLSQCLEAGVLAGYLIATHTRCTDVYQLYRRRKAMSLAASMQWDLLPPLVLRAPGCSVAGRLEPAYEVGGDCFDYALNGNVLDLALVDAMGHGVNAATIAALAIGCYRQGRRESRDLAVSHRELNDVLQRQFGGEAFATGQLAELDIVTGTLSWTNAGHPHPLLLRNGQALGQLEGHTALPWGLDDESPKIAIEHLEPRDNVLFFTDGVIEARAEDGSEFGIGRLIDIAGQFAHDGAPPEEVVRQIVRSVLEHRRDELRDDATVVLVEWPGPPE